jgi:hypothetical protein
MRSMLGRLFPRMIDNAYPGSGLAFWLLVPVMGAKLAIGLRSMINPRGVIEDADGIALAPFGHEGALTMMFQYQTWGLGLVLFVALVVVALARYRAMVPLVCLLLLAENVGRKIISVADGNAAIPHNALASVPFLINAGFDVLLGGALLLSLWPPRSRLA